ncbi:MAG: tetratricopeptide repeat protein [Pseudomonadota bacterium]
MSFASVLRTLCLLGLVVTLAACQSSEERAEEHYENALRLIAEGDTDRAAVEFRNVFQNNGQHRDARAAFAAMLRETGDSQGSYSQYLRLVEQYPDDIEGRIALAEMAIDGQNWDEARRHGERALELAPDHEAIPVIALNLSYAAAVEEEDATARREVVDEVREIVQDDPDNLLLRRVLIDTALRDGEAEQALTEIDAALDLDPDGRSLYDTRLRLLARLQRTDEVEALLREMIERFPEDGELQGMLLRFFMSRGQIDQAEAYLRDIVETAEDPEARRDAQAALVRMALQRGGAEAGLAEIDAILAGLGEGEDSADFEALRAGILFDSGQRDVAIADMEALLETELSTEESGRIRVALARMLLGTGNQVGARALIEEVLAADETQIDALKIKAGWLIEDDEMREAVNLLRLVLDQDPGDAQAMTLTAQAHARNGDNDLAREFLALAVEASGAAPQESIRYAEYLIAEERWLAAEEILISSLRLAPGEPGLLSTLGQLYIGMEDWSRAQQVEDTLRRQDTPTAERIAAGLQASRLAGQGRIDDAIEFLEGVATAGEGGDMTANIAVVQARLASGDADGALNYIDTLLADNPDDLTLRFVQATAFLAVGRADDAVDLYRALVTETPTAENIWIALIRALYAQGDIEGAEATLDEGLAAVPDGLNLLWAQASFRERQFDFEGAIALYEQMYERAPNQPVIANNLASLLSTYRDDVESLDRAYTVARRLRGSDFAPFQDTYGWIAYRRGDYDEALEHLEPASVGLPEDPLVQFHLAMTYAALDRPEDAIAQHERALSLAGAEDTRPQFETARAEIERLQALLAEAEAEADAEAETVSE